ncbi:hypothetical protein [Candidatus Protochlamydia phocaeensis]|uniref:hypothetical protein n=1 Tax=Candidatus Protochlamydia phocaeensis TaxID=1414722 RepID=UPI00083957B5|nr:hypothetical protein [Candidatus Protochlamydia phocaeensis]
MTINSFSFATLDSGLIAFESVLNIIGYLPVGQRYLKDRHSNSVYLNPYYDAKQSITNLRSHYGKVLIIAGLAGSILSFGLSLYHSGQKEFYQRLAVRILQYAGHGVLNIVRSSIESRGWGIAALAYDLYNKKLLSYQDASPQFDLQGRLFVYIRLQLDKLPNLLASGYKYFK